MNAFQTTFFPISLFCFSLAVGVSSVISQESKNTPKKIEKKKTAPKPTKQKIKVNKKPKQRLASSERANTPFIQHLMGKIDKSVPPRIAFLNFLDKTPTQSYGYFSRSVIDTIKGHLNKKFPYQKISDVKIRKILSKIRKKNSLRQNEINLKSLESLAEKENLDFIIYGEFNRKVTRKQKKAKKINIIIRVYFHYAKKSVPVKKITSQVNSRLLTKLVQFSQAAILKMNEQINIVKEKSLAKIEMKIARERAAYIKKQEEIDQKNKKIAQNQKRILQQKEKLLQKKEALLQKEKILLKEQEELLEGLSQKKRIISKDQEELFQKQEVLFKKQDDFLKEKKKLLEKKKKLRQEKKKQRAIAEKWYKIEKLKETATPVLFLSKSLKEFTPKLRKEIEDERDFFIEYLLLKYQYNLMSYNKYRRKLEIPPFEKEEERLSQWLVTNKVIRLVLQTVKEGEIKSVIFVKLLKELKQIEYNLHAEKSTKEAKLDVIAKILEIDEAQRRKQIKAAALKPNDLWYEIGFAPFHQITSGPNIKTSELNFQGAGLNLYGNISLGGLLEASFKRDNLHWLLHQFYLGFNIGFSYSQNSDELQVESSFIGGVSTFRQDRFLQRYVVFTDVRYRFPIIDLIKVDMVLGGGYYISFSSQESFKDSVSTRTISSMNQGPLALAGIEINFDVSEILSLHIGFGDYLYFSNVLTHGFYSSLRLSFPLSFRVWVLKRDR